MDPALLLVTIGVLGMLCQWLAWQLKVPAILPLLLTGLVAGPATGFLDPDALFGDLLFPLVSLGVAVVLFEGSLSLRLHEIRGLARVVRNLVLIGAPVTWLATTLATWWLVDFDWELALLFGAVVVVTGPTVIIPLLRTMRARAGVGNILRWEGIIIDPIGALLAVLVFNFIVSGREGSTLLTFAGILLSGGLIGLAGAWVTAQILKRHLLPHFLVNVTLLTLVLAVFAGANALQHESGLLAVTLMGIVLTNMRDVPVEEIIDFKESLSVMIVSVLFIILAARVDPAQLVDLGWGALGVLGIVMLVARPAAVLISAWGSKTSIRERLLLSWIAPRGIVAAAVSALFALRLDALGYPGADLLVPLTFMVIIGTVLVQGLTARPVAQLLGVAEPEPRGVLILGADNLARAVGQALEHNGFPVLLADTSWSNIRAARMEGLSTYFGNPVSEHADRNLDLVGVGRLFAMSMRPTFNALACVRYRNEFGAENVYALQSPEEQTSEKTAIARQFACRRLFGDDVTKSKLASLLGQGGEIRSTSLTESFGMEEYQAKYRNKAVPLFAVDTRGHLHVFTANRELEPAAGWKLVGLLPADALETTEEGTTERKSELRKAEHQQRHEASGR